MVCKPPTWFNPLEKDWQEVAVARAALPACMLCGQPVLSAGIPTAPVCLIDVAVGMASLDSFVLGICLLPLCQRGRIPVGLYSSMLKLP